MSARGAADVHRGRWISSKVQSNRVNKLTHRSSLGRSTWFLVHYDGKFSCQPLRVSLRSGVWVNCALVTRRSSGDSNHERFLQLIRAIANERGFSSPYKFVSKCRVSLIDWISDTRPQGYTDLQSLVKCLDHRCCGRDNMQSCKAVLGCAMH